MTRRAGIVVACSVLALAACAVQPDEVNLRDSFVAQIAAVDGVTDVVRDGDELMFSAPDGRGGTGSWRVRFNLTDLRAGPREGAPLEGHIASSWWQNDEVVEPLGSMSGLPTVIQDAGIAQVCYALWDAEQQSWGWL
jgi:hypothetical protein